MLCNFERRQHLTLFATGLMLVLCALWGLQQVTIKIVNEEISPILQAGIRSIIAAVCLTIWMYARNIRIFVNDNTLVLGVISGLLFGFEFLLIYLGLNYTTASRGVIFIFTAPFFVALGIHFFVPNERLSFIQVLGMILAFAGIIVVFGEGLSVLTGDEWKGDILIFIGAILWAATTVLIRATKLSSIAPSRTLYYQLVVSALILPPLSYAAGETGITNLSPLIIGCLIYQSVIVAFASYLVWFWLIAHYPAPKLSAYTFFTPLFGVLFGVILLSDPLSIGLILGLCLVAIGIFVVNKK